MFNLPPSERLARWKQFRLSLNFVDLPNAIDLTQKFWQKCPFTPFYLDQTKPDSWPDPWQLILENYYCDVAKCLGMLYTLHLSDHSFRLQPELRIYTNYENKHQHCIAYLCDGKYVANLIEGEVVNKQQINQKLRLIHCYSAEDLRLEQY